MSDLLLNACSTISLTTELNGIKNNIDFLRWCISNDNTFYMEGLLDLLCMNKIYFETGQGSTIFYTN